MQAVTTQRAAKQACEAPDEDPAHGAGGGKGPLASISRSPVVQNAPIYNILVQRPPTVASDRRSIAEQRVLAAEKEGSLQRAFARTASQPQVMGGTHEALAERISVIAVIDRHYLQEHARLLDNVLKFESGPTAIKIVTFEWLYYAMNALGSDNPYVPNPDDYLHDCHGYFRCWADGNLQKDEQKMVTRAHNPSSKSAAFYGIPAPTEYATSKLFVGFKHAYQYGQDINVELAPSVCEGHPNDLTHRRETQEHGRSWLLPHAEAKRASSCSTPESTYEGGAPSLIEGTEGDSEAGRSNGFDSAGTLVRSLAPQHDDSYVGILSTREQKGVELGGSSEAGSAGGAPASEPGCDSDLDMPDMIDVSHIDSYDDEMTAATVLGLPETPIWSQQSPVNVNKVASGSLAFDDRLTKRSTPIRRRGSGDNALMTPVSPLSRHHEDPSQAIQTAAQFRRRDGPGSGTTTFHIPLTPLRSVTYEPNTPEPTPHRAARFAGPLEIPAHSSNSHANASSQLNGSKNCFAAASPALDSQRAVRPRPLEEEPGAPFGHDSVGEPVHGEWANTSAPRYVRDSSAVSGEAGVIPAPGQRTIANGLSEIKVFDQLCRERDDASATRDAARRELFDLRCQHIDLSQAYQDLNGAYARFVDDADVRLTEAARKNVDLALELVIERDVYQASQQALLSGKIGLARAVQTLRSELEASAETSRQLEAKLEASVAAHQPVIKECYALRGKLEVARRELRIAGAQTDTLGNDLEEALGEIDTLRSDLNSARNELKFLQHELEVARSELVKAREELTASVDTGHRLGAKLDAAVAEHRPVLEERNALREGLEARQAECTELRAEFDRSRVALEEFATDNERLRLDDEKHAIELVRLQNKVDNQAAEAACMRRQVATLESERDALQHENAQQKTELEKSRREISNLDVALASLKRLSADCERRELAEAVMSHINRGKVTEGVSAGTVADASSKRRKRSRPNQVTSVYETLAGASRATATATAARVEELEGKLESVLGRLDDTLRESAVADQQRRRARQALYGEASSFSTKDQLSLAQVKIEQLELQLAQQSRLLNLK